jgi:hypothetical protein
MQEITFPPPTSNPEPIMATIIEQPLSTTAEPMFALIIISVKISIPSHAMESVLPTSYWNKAVVGITEVFWLHTPQRLQYSLKKHKDEG